MVRGRILGSFSFLVAVISIGVVAFPQFAKADPHAVFYTAIGQQQLFFNVLAALNQADYVEPALGNFSRDELAQRREVADQANNVSVREAVEETKTDLSAVLTRLITLDGTDLWTNYLALQLAKESAQHTDITAYAEILCAQGLGRLFDGPDEFCENDAPVGEALIAQKRAFVVDPQERAGLALQHGLDAVYSDKSAGSDYQKYIEYLEDPDTKKIDIATDYPVPLDEPVAALRKKANGDLAKELAVDRLSAAATGYYRTSYVDDNVFDLLTSTPDGSVRLRTPPNNQSGTANINLYMAAVQGITDLPQQFVSTAARGAAVAEQHLAFAETEGAVAPVSSKPNQGADGEWLGHNVDIASPPYVNREQIAAGLNALGSANAVPQAPPAVAELVPGVDPLIDRVANVAGTQDDQREGRVLHAADPSTEGRFDEQDVGLNLFTDDPTNPTAVHEETGGKHLLLALTDGSRDRSGCGCGVNHVLNDLGQAILGKINGWRL